ncbi:murein biosynthesis integral membrane protein MurJ [Verrucomicrobia bacterium LW23]|nr:murein biosynthesis integral membrane protein MurJ [Verrucomicrobia bacterium LW23]
MTAPQRRTASGQGPAGPAGALSPAVGGGGAAAPAGAEKAGRRRNAAIVGIAVIGSRMMGLVREAIVSRLFGSSMFADAYYAAFQLPNLLRDLFAEGALSTAFTTTFSKIQEKDGAASAWDLARLVLTFIIVVVGGLCVLGMIFAPQLVYITNPGFAETPGKLEAAALYTRVMFPFILFASMGAVVMGILNARHIFGIPASASTVFNIVSVVLGVTLAYTFEPQENFWRPHFGEVGMLWFSVGVLIGGLAQLGIQLPWLFMQGFRYRWQLDFRDSRLIAVLKLAVPAAIAGAAVQVNVLVNGVFASSIPGGRVWLNCAFRLMQFPIGVFGVAIATVTLPAVAKQQARQDLRGFGTTVQESLRLAFFLTLPAAVGLAVLARPLIHIIYGGLNFHSYDVMYAAHALQAYTVGLSAYAAIKVLVPCFYALDQPSTPFNVSMLGILFNLIFNLIFTFYLNMGVVGLALSTALIAQINFLQLLWALNKRVDCGRGEMWLPYFMKVSCATVACGAMAAGVELVTRPTSQPIVGCIAALILCIMLGAGAYFVVSVWMGLPEATDMANMVGRKLGFQMKNRTRPRVAAGIAASPEPAHVPAPAPAYPGPNAPTSAAAGAPPRPFGQQSAAVQHGQAGAPAGGTAPQDGGHGAAYGSHASQPYNPALRPSPHPRRPPEHRRRRRPGPPGRRR